MSKFPHYKQLDSMDFGHSCNGTSGIAWIYRQLHRLTGGGHFKEEMDYWTSQTARSGITDELYPGSGTEKSYGILEGLTGNLLISEILGTKGF